MKSKPLVMFLAGFIVGLLVAVGGYVALIYFAVSPASSGAPARTRTEANMTGHAQACYNYFKDAGHWPPTLAALGPASGGRVYIDMPPNQLGMDAWGHPFIYQPPVQPQTFAMLVSHGADGVPGGAGDKADIEFRLTDYGISRPWMFP